MYVHDTDALGEVGGQREEQHLTQVLQSQPSHEFPSTATRKRKNTHVVDTAALAHGLDDSGKVVVGEDHLGCLLRNLRYIYQWNGSGFI